VLGVKSLQGAG